MSRIEILNAKQIQKKLNRLAYEVYENNISEKEMLIAGVDGNGFTIAKRLEEILNKISPLKTRLGKITINKENPMDEAPELDFTEKDFKNKSVLIVDDVLNSGKTLIYATKVFLTCPVKKMHTIVLVDRSHNRYPVKADYVGISLSTTLQEHVIADLSKKGKEVVYLE